MAVEILDGTALEIRRELDKRESVVVRFHLWEEGLGVIGKHPLTGMGMNQFRYLPEIGHEMSHAHNHLIHTAAELGIPGLMAYLAILMGAGFMCWEVRRKSRDAFIRAAVVGLGAGQLAHFIFGLGDSIPLGAKPGIFFWLSLALITAMYHYVRREELRSPRHSVPRDDKGPATDFRFQKKSEPVSPEIGKCLLKLT